MDSFLMPIISYEKKLKPLMYSKEHVLYNTILNTMFEERM